MVRHKRKVDWRMVTYPKNMNPFRGLYYRGSDPKFDEKRTWERGIAPVQPHNSIVFSIMSGREGLVELDKIREMRLLDSSSGLGRRI